MKAAKLSHESALGKKVFPAKPIEPTPDRDLKLADLENLIFQMLHVSSQDAYQTSKLMQRHGSEALRGLSQLLVALHNHQPAEARRQLQIILDARCPEPETPLPEKNP